VFPVRYELNYTCYVEEGGLVVRVPGFTTEKYCVSCEVRTGFIYEYVEEGRPPL
jgi:hypothetical protein